MSKATKATKTATTEATFTKPEVVTPESRKGKSKLENPVGHIWVLCIKATAANEGVAPKRSDLTRESIAIGAAYYTARTQVDRFLRWDRNGRPEGGLPRGVTL